MPRYGISLVLAFALGACGDDTTQPAADADIGIPEFTVQNMDASGIMHSVTFRCVELLASTPQIFTSDGPHAHTLRLEVAQMQSILAGERIAVVFTDAHEHSFPIQKPDDACVGLGD